MIAADHRRWFSYTLRTLFVVAILAAAFGRMNAVFLWEAIDVPVLLKTVLTVWGIVMLILVWYAERIFDADEDGEYAPYPKYMFYVWIPYFLVAIWAGAPPAIWFIVGGALAIANELYSTFFAGSDPPKSFP